MRVAIYIRQPTEPHEAVARAVQVGSEKCGETSWTFGKDAPQHQDAEVVIVFGIGGDAKQVWDANPQARRILLDKPYVRNNGIPMPNRYHVVRVSIDAPQPLAYFQKIPRRSARWDRMKLFPKPYTISSQNKAILFDGASNKYCLWNNLPDWPVWGQQVVDRIRQHATNPVIYRPRPSHNDAPKSITGAELSEGPIVDDLARARVVVSHGGNIGFDAVFAGVPHFAIDCSIARPISETDWSRCGIPYVPDYLVRRQWFYDVAYCQWSLDEFADGSAWRYVRECMELGNG